MTWKDLPRGRKMMFGFGVVLLLFAGTGMPSMMGINTVYSRGLSVAESSKISGELLQREVDHLKWAQEVERFANLREVQALLKKMVDSGREQITAAETTTGHAAGRSRSGVFLFCALTLAAGALLAWLITRSIAGPLEQGVRFAEAVAGGDLNSQLAIDQRDQVGKLAAALNGMVSRLNETVVGVKAAPETVFAASRQHSSAAGFSIY